jgi:CP family cyanate transporter-like MFS transporter
VSSRNLDIVNPVSVPPLNSFSPVFTRGRLVALTVAVMFTAALLRAPILAVAPVAGTIGTDLGVSAAVVGLLTSIPVLAFAICSPLSVWVIRRGGIDFALSLCLAGAIVGCLIRSAGGLTAALVGTAVIGLFLTIGNVVVPIIIAREFPPERAHFMTGVYTSAINIGTMTVTFATAPLAEQIGWQGAIVVWAGFGVVALAVWLGLHGVRGALVPRPGSASVPTGEAPPSVMRSASTWLLGAAFAGQAFSFYGVTAWLPSLLKDEGFATAAAGGIAAIFQVTGIAGALLVPILTTRVSILSGVLFVAVGWLAIPIGFAVDPGLWWLWCAVGGVAQGGGLTVVFIMIGALGGGPDTVAGRSGIVQGVGYGLAAVGPIALGAIHEAAGSWLPVLAVVGGAVVLFGVAGSLAAAPLRRR